MRHHLTPEPGGFEGLAFSRGLEAMDRSNCAFGRPCSSRSSRTRRIRGSPTTRMPGYLGGSGAPTLPGVSPRFHRVGVAALTAREDGRRSRVMWTTKEQAKERGDERDLFERSLDGEGRRGGSVCRGLDRVRPVAHHDAGSRNPAAHPEPERTAKLSEIRAVGERRGHARVEERPGLPGKAGRGARTRRGVRPERLRAGRRGLTEPQTTPTDE